MEAGADLAGGGDADIIGTGAVPVRPPIGGRTRPGALGAGDGVHLLHSMGDTFAVMRTLEQNPHLRARRFHSCAKR